jgi:murein DD-endopeptidase MepM/ murein hydrolase activator NlpD
VGVTHEGVEKFMSVYAHLSRFFVTVNESIKRGQLIGLSGVGTTPNWAHLHFGIVKTEGNWLDYSNTYDPNDFWLAGRPSCFDPQRDYTEFEVDEITFPVACGSYRRQLLNNLPRKKKLSPDSACP